MILKRLFMSHRVYIFEIPGRCKLWVSYTAGLNSVSFEKNINPLDILKTYYIKKRDEINVLDAYHRAKEEVIHNVKNS